MEMRFENEGIYSDEHKPVNRALLGDPQYYDDFKVVMLRNRIRNVFKKTFATKEKPMFGNRFKHAQKEHEFNSMASAPLKMEKRKS
jgi:hypothetical protein